MTLGRIELLTKVKFSLHFNFSNMANIIIFKGGLAELTQQVVSHKGLVVADFHASWCPSCRRLGQLLPAVASENENVLFLKIDVDDCPELKENYGIASIPHVKFFKSEGGALKELGVVQGPNVPQIKEKIAEFNH